MAPLADGPAYNLVENLGAHPHLPSYAGIAASTTVSTHWVIEPLQGLLLPRDPFRSRIPRRVCNQNGNRLREQRTHSSLRRVSRAEIKDNSFIKKYISPPPLASRSHAHAWVLTTIDSDYRGQKGLAKDILVYIARPQRSRRVGRSRSWRR